jgi:hypothetical protein
MSRSPSSKARRSTAAGSRCRRSGPNANTRVPTTKIVALAAKTRQYIDIAALSCRRHWPQRAGAAGTTTTGQSAVATSSAVTVLRSRRRQQWRVGLPTRMRVAASSAATRASSSAAGPTSTRVSTPSRTACFARTRSRSCRPRCSAPVRKADRGPMSSTWTTTRRRPVSTLSRVATRSASAAYGESSTPQTSVPIVLLDDDAHRIVPGGVGCHSWLQPFLPRNGTHAHACGRASRTHLVGRHGPIWGRHQ